MRAITNIRGKGKKSIVLPSNVEITNIIQRDKKLTIYIEATETEVEVAYYNVYVSDIKPSKLGDMKKVKMCDVSTNCFTIDGLTNSQTYYIAVESVSVEGYENASIWKVKEGMPNKMRFITLGSCGNIKASYYSVDGENWIDMSNIITGNKIAYGNGRFVIVGDKGSSYSSTDGVNWIAMDGLPSKENYTAIAYGDNRFVCISKNSGSSYYCIDGVNWIAMGNLGGASYTNYNELTYVGNGTFYCSYIETTTNEDGFTHYYSGCKILKDTSWTKTVGAEVPYSYSYRHYAYGNGGIVTIYTNDRNGTTFYYSSDVVKSVKTNGISSSYYYCDAVYGRDRFVTVGSAGSSYYSINGVNWVAMKGASTSMNYVTYGNERFVAVGYSGSSYYSTNGVNWVAMNGISNSYSCYDVVSN